MFNQFRYDAYLEYTKLLNGFEPNKASIEDAASLYKQLDGLSFSHQFLFEGRDNKTYQELLATLKHIIMSIQTFKSTYEPLRKKEKDVTDKYPIVKDVLNVLYEGEPPGEYLFKNYEKYPLQRQIFIGFMQRVISNGNRKPYETWDIDRFLEDGEKRRKAKKEEM